MTDISFVSPFSALSTAGYGLLFGAPNLVSSTTTPDVATSGTLASLFLPPTSSLLAGNTMLSLLTTDQSNSPATDLLGPSAGWSSNAAAAAYSSTLIGTLEASNNYLNASFDESVVSKLSDPNLTVTPSTDVSA